MFSQIKVREKFLTWGTFYKLGSDVQVGKDNAQAALREFGKSQSPHPAEQPGGKRGSLGARAARARDASGSTMIIAKCQGVLSVAYIKMFYFWVFVGWQWRGTLRLGNMERKHFLRLLMHLSHQNVKASLLYIYSKIVPYLFRGFVHLLAHG